MAKEWIAGRRPVYETLKAGRRQIFQFMIAEGVQDKGTLADILQVCQERGIPILREPRSRLEAVDKTNQGVLLQASSYPYSDLATILKKASVQNEPPFLLILDALKDPQNLGTLLRTAEAVGVHGVLLPFRRTATITPAVVNASSGACEHLQVAQLNLAQAIASIKEAGVWVIGLESGKDAQPPSGVRLDGALALVVGSEGSGMRRLVTESCDILMKLPMRGHVDSLNAAVAGSIVLYLAWQARGYPKE
jgi:23S rRNA (guanosine2251-2'-O)-methyltransferase